MDFSRNKSEKNGFGGIVVPYPGAKMKELNEDAPEGFEVDLRIDPKYDYVAIEVVDFNHSFRASRLFFPTQYLAMNNPYWQCVQNLATEDHDGQVREILNMIDGCLMKVQALPNGRIYVTRNGVKVIVQYEDGSTGGFDQPAPLLLVESRTPTKPRRKENCVSTQNISLDCPYWAQLVSGLVSPKNKGLTIWVRSAFDGVKCLVLLETDGSVQIRRDNVQVQILGPY